MAIRTLFKHVIGQLILLPTVMNQLTHVPLPICTWTKSKFILFTQAFKGTCGWKYDVGKGTSWLELISTVLLYELGNLFWNQTGRRPSHIANLSCTLKICPSRIKINCDSFLGWGRQMYIHLMPSKPPFPNINLTIQVLKKMWDAQWFGTVPMREIGHETTLWTPYTWYLWDANRQCATTWIETITIARPLRLLDHSCSQNTRDA